MLKHQQLSQEELAAKMNVSRLTVSQIANGRRSITAETAVRLEYSLGASAEFWLNLQRDVELALVRKRFRRQKRLPRPSMATR
jgi:addiction module HigA family antidote